MSLLDDCLNPESPEGFDNTTALLRYKQSQDDRNFLRRLIADIQDEDYLGMDYADAERLIQILRKTLHRLGYRWDAKGSMSFPSQHIDQDLYLATLRLSEDDQILRAVGM